MATVTFSMPDKVKSEMKEFPWVNWSELAREQVIRQVERARLFDELDELTKDSKLTDEDCLKLGRLVKQRIWKRLQEKS